MGGGGNIRLVFREIGVNMRIIVVLAHDWDYQWALVNAAFNLRVSEIMKLEMMFV